MSARCPFLLRSFSLPFVDEVKKNAAVDPGKANTARMNAAVLFSISSSPLRSDRAQNGGPSRNETYIRVGGSMVSAVKLLNQHHNLEASRTKRSWRAWVISVRCDALASLLYRTAPETKSPSLRLIGLCLRPNTPIQPLTPYLLCLSETH